LEWMAIALTNMAARTYVEGRWEETLESSYRIREIQETIGDRWQASLTAYNIAEILADQGRLEEAEPLAAAALRDCRATQAHAEAAQGMSLLGRIAARRGVEGARSLLHDARDLYIESDQPAEALRTDAWIAESLVLDGDAGGAFVLIAETLDRSTETEGL